MAEEPLKPEPRKDPPIDYLAIANDFLRETGTSVVNWSNLYWSYNGKCYERVGDGSADEFKLDVAQWLGVEFRGCSNTRRSADEIEFQCRANLRLGRRQSMPGFLGDTTPRPRIITLANGILDLEPCAAGLDPVLSDHKPNWFCTSALPFEFRRDAECPRWLSFLNDCLEGDVQRIALLQEWFGYCCSHDTSFEKALLMEGPGGNGKSQAIEVLNALLGGDTNCSAVPLEKIGHRFQDYAMVGKLVNFCAEVPENCYVNISALRQLITGDNYQFERKGIDPFMARPTARLVIAMNTRPKFHDPSNALWRRVMLMPWTYEVPAEKRVLDLGKKIAAEELPGIFLWAIEGLKRLWKNRKFTESKAVEVATNNMRAENDPIRSELTTLLCSDEAGFITSSELWELHNAYCNESVESVERGTPASLAAAVRRVFPLAAPAKRTVSGSQCRGWSGIAKRNPV